MALAILFTLLPISTFAESGDELEYSEETAVEISSEPASNDAASEEQATEPEQVPEAVVTEDAGPASGSDPTDNTDPDVSDDPQIDDTADSAPDADEPASTQEENTTTPEDPAPEPEPETAAGKVPELRVEYTQPLADSQITDQTPLRAGIMRAPRLRALAVSSGSISNFNAEVFYGGVWDDIDTDGNGEVDEVNQYVWRAQSSAANHHFNFRISFTLGNDGSLGAYKGSVDGDAAGVHITVPKTILKTRTGAQGDYLEMSIPSREDVLESIKAGEPLDSDMSFAWYEEGDHIVLYNYRDIDPGFDAFIELSYVTNSVTFDYVDMTKSDIFQTTIEAVLTDEDGNKKPTDKAANEAGPVWIDTQVALLSTESRIPVKYDTWPWGDPPANYPDKVQNKDGEWVDFNPNDYIYFVWEIRSRINDNSQMYDFTIDDVLGNLKCSQNGVDTTDQIPEGSAFPVAIKFSGQSGYEVGSTATIQDQTLTGLRYDYVLTAFRKDFWNEQTHWEMTNDSTVTVHPVDGLDPDSSATFRRNFYWNKPIYQGGGPGNFGAWKRADGYYRYRADRNEWPRTYLSELGMVAGDYSRYDLGDLIEGKVDHLDNLDYAVGAEGVALRWTLDRDYVKSDENPEYNNYYVEPVKYVVIDDEFYVFDEQDGIPNADQKPDARLTYKDFQIDTIALNITCYDRDYNSSTAAFDTAKPVTYLNNAHVDGVGDDYNETIKVYGKFGTSEEWVWLADYDVATRKITDTNPSYVKGNTNSKLTLVDNCVGYKLETYNTHYYSRIGSVPNIRIKNSEKILSTLKYDANNNLETQTIGINNVMRAQLFDYKSAYGASTAADRDSLSTEPYTHIVFNSSDNDTDYVRTVEKDVELNKNVVATANVPKKKQYVITWKIDMKETYTTDAQGTRAPIEQNGGVFYDLLPDGATLDPASVLVVTEDGDLRVNAYTVEQQQNYKGTGRSLLIVKIKEPADWYEVYYDTIHPYESIRDYGNLVYNPVAYETGNADITSGVTNDATAKPLAGDPTRQIEQAELMTNLPADATGKQFIYTEREYDIAAITAASSGLSKKVLTANSSAYGNDGITPNGKIYSYRLRFQNSFANKAKDLIFFDSLENYVANGRSSDWQGTLQSVDLKLLREKGIDPKVYISTVEDLNIKDHNDLSDTSIWTFVDPDKDDLSEARAIAIDMRKKDDGTEFVLEEGGTLTAYLYLRAPQGAKRLDDTEGYPETYNNIYISRIILTETETAAPNLTHQDYTTVGLVITGDVNLRKISSTDREGIRDISFRLRGTSDYGTPIDLFQSSDRNGYLTFKDVEMGTYILSEYEATPDWLEDHTEHTVQITALGEVLIDGTDYTDDTIEIENDPRIHADLLFLKRQAVIEGDDSKPVIPDTTFELSGTSDYGNDISIIATSNVLGIVALRDVEKGTYILKEIKANDDYVLSDAEYRVVVDGDGNITVTEKKEMFGATVLMPVDQDGIYPVIYNNPKYWDFSFRKVDAENITRWLEGATFTLTGANISEQPVKLDENGDPVLDEDGNTIPDGDPVNYLTATSDKNGKVTFSHLEAGSYILKETQAPTGLDGTGKKTDGGTLNYLADSAEYIVVVSEDGTITIDGLTKNSLGEYMVKNGRSLDGEIIVYKKWEDLDDAQRENPVVHLVPDPDSLTIHGITVTKEWAGDYPDARPEDVTIALQKIPATVDQRYTIVDYIESRNGANTVNWNGAYIDTGYIPNGNTTVDATFAFVEGTERHTVFGSRDENNEYGPRYMLYDGYVDGYKNLYCFYGKSNGPEDNHLMGSPVDGKKYTAHMSPTGITMTAADNKSEVFFNTSYNQQTFSLGDDRSMYICAVHTEKGLASSQVRIYSFRIYNGSTLVRDYIPVYDNENCVYGLYDLVDGKFYGNAGGNGSFTGPTPPDPSPLTISSEAGEWKKNGNTWTYTFDVEVDGKSQYYVYETEDPDNYTGSATGEKNKVPVNGGKATITNTYKGLIENFDYTGDVQEWTAPVSGYYQLETWGAQGGDYYITSHPGQHMGNTGSRGGYGGYSTGKIYLEAGTTLYVIVGGSGKTSNGTAISATSPLEGGYNGGGWMLKGTSTAGWSNSGGGMTHISTTSNPVIHGQDWDPSGTLLAAGGGGGADNPNGNSRNRGSGDDGGGGDGGGAYGGNALINGKESANTGGGLPGNTYQVQGQGQDNIVQTDTGAGGGGWYGGKCTGNNNGGAGGGSGYISPKLKNAETIAGNLTFKAPGGNDETGHSGNGYARITFISHDNPAPPSQTDTTIPETPTLPSTEYISNGEWEKIDDDTWRYVFHVFNDDAEFTYWEERIEGYNSASYDPATFDGSTQKSVVITNTSTAAYGSLTVTKTVKGLENSTQKFDFTVTLTGDHITNSGTQVIDGIVFTDGEATFSLADGESKTISNIPAGTTYAVAEAENENFTVTYTDKTGSIAANETKTATVTNTYKPPEINPVDVTLKKVVTGNVSGTEGDEYTFFASFENLAGEMEYVVSDGTNEITRFTSDKDGKASVSLKLQADGIAIFKDIPVGATYRIMEDAGDYVSSFFISGTGGSIIQTAGENTQKQQSLSTATETAEQGESVTVTFSNRLENTQTLTVKKLVDKQGYNVEDEAFEVTVTFTGLAPFGTITSSIGRWVADDMGQVEKTFTLKDGESIVFSDVPVGVHYTVAEAKNRYTASYEITADDPSHARFVNEGKGGNDAPNTKLTTAEETVDRYENATVTLVNTLTTADLSISKTVSGNMGNKTRSFAFTVTIPEMANRTVTPRDKDGDALDEETFDEKGVITVHLKHGETIAIPGVPVGASYTVKEDNGLYTATYQVSGGAKQNGAEVTGTMPATGLEVAYNNELNVAVPTGADSIPYTAMMLFAILPVIMICKRRRRQKGR